LEVFETKIEDNQVNTGSLNSKYGVFEAQSKKLEDNLRDHLEIIQNINQKLNSISESNQQLKKDFYEKFIKLEKQRLTQSQGAPL